MNNRTADSTQKAIKDRLRSLPPKACRSITYDNGHENTRHERINHSLGTRSYFCCPYHSWEKASVENTNGLIRRFIRKGTEIKPLQHRFIRRIEYLLNNRPRKCLRFYTPAEIFKKFGGAFPP